MNSIKNFFSNPWLSALFAVGLLTTLIVINRQRGRIVKLESSVSEYEDKLIEIRSRVDKMEKAINHLRNNVNDFEYENWRDVVPEVESATSSIESELEYLKSASN